jgi:hypothetical protein
VVKYLNGLKGGICIDFLFNELQVDKTNRTEVEVVTHCDELQVDKTNRTEVEVITHCDELQEHCQ